MTTKCVPLSDKDKAHFEVTASIDASCVLFFPENLNQQMNQIMEDQQKQMVQIMEATYASMKAGIMAIVNDAMTVLKQEVAGAIQASAISVYPISENLNNYNKNDKEHIDEPEIMSNRNKKDKAHIDETLSMTTFCVPLSEYLHNCNMKDKPHFASIFKMVEIERNVVSAGLPRCGIG